MILYFLTISLMSLLTFWLAYMVIGLVGHFRVLYHSALFLFTLPIFFLLWSLSSLCFHVMDIPVPSLLPSTLSRSLPPPSWSLLYIRDSTHMDVSVHLDFSLERENMDSPGRLVH